LPGFGERHVRIDVRVIKFGIGFAEERNPLTHEFLSENIWMILALFIVVCLLWYQAHFDHLAESYVQNMKLVCFGIVVNIPKTILTI
jgi:hypothetical protein